MISILRRGSSNKEMVGNGITSARMIPTVPIRQSPRLASCNSPARMWNRMARGNRNVYVVFAEQNPLEKAKDAVSNAADAVKGKAKSAGEDATKVTSDAREGLFQKQIDMENAKDEEEDREWNLPLIGDDSRKPEKEALKDQPVSDKRKGDISKQIDAMAKKSDQEHKQWDTNSPDGPGK
eukprot:CAMPEP_0184494542 /NCGR_PEP_ID=MMETSP0113_2-20130426/28996_1 /TAXON_ID=91329 /ORGANISM="Norrisiella sphaerica, Strain BC52" /LENGTH=179 /DNA_ID=CAMNT_0026880339 /DNA_START=95 /DNA_END=634 /DNA_ORIENTATION=+